MGKFKNPLGRAGWLALGVIIVLAGIAITSLTYVTSRPGQLGALPGEYQISIPADTDVRYVVPLNRVKNRGSGDLEFISAELIPKNESGAELVDVRVSGPFTGNQDVDILLGDRWPNNMWSNKNTQPLEGFTLPSNNRATIFLIIKAHKSGCYSWDAQRITYRTGGIFGGTNSQQSNVHIKLNKPSGKDSCSTSN